MTPGMLGVSALHYFSLSMVYGYKTHSPRHLQPGGKADPGKTPVAVSLPVLNVCSSVLEMFCIMSCFMLFGPQEE